MGFPSEDVARALRQTGGNYEAACALLVGENDDVSLSSLFLYIYKYSSPFSILLLSISSLDFRSLFPSRFPLSISALDFCFRFLLSISAFDFCSRFLLSISALDFRSCFPLLTNFIILLFIYFSFPG
jgi:hypothetical protein